MTNQKNTKKTPPQSLLYAFESFGLEATERELDEALEQEGIDPEDLLAKANRSIERALAADQEDNSSSENNSSSEDVAFHRGLQTLITLLRREKGLSEQQLADHAEVDVEDIKAIENDTNFEPGPRTIFQLEKYFKLEPKSLGIMSGAIKINSTEFTDGMLQFAAQSKEIGKLNRDEKRLLSEFVKFVSKYAKKLGQ